MWIDGLYWCYIVLYLAIWNEHQEKIDIAHKLLRSAQDKLEEQIKMRKEQVSVNKLKSNLILLLYNIIINIIFRINNLWALIWLLKNYSLKTPNLCLWFITYKPKLIIHQITIQCKWCFTIIVITLIMYINFLIIF